METIPLEEDSCDRQPEAPSVPAEANPAPLAVEPLEDRVLLASDTAPAAPLTDAPPIEPAPYVAPQHAGLAIDLGDAVEAAGAETVESNGVHGSSNAGQPWVRLPSQGEAELVENKSEAVEKAVPEHNDSGESPLDRNEFGLATIEPEAGSPEVRNSPSNDRLLRKLVALDGPQEKKAAEPGAHDGGAEAAVPQAVDLVVSEVATELDPALAKTIQVETQLGFSTAGPQETAGADALSNDKNLDALVQPVLKSQPFTEPPPVQEAAEDFSVAKISADTNLDQQTIGAVSDSSESVVEGHPEAEYQNHRAAPDGLPEMPPAAHDALFAEGNGVEAVLAPARNA